MKNFLAIFDGYNMRQSTLRYAMQLAQDANAHLTGVFLNEFLYHTYNISEVVFHNQQYSKVIEALDTKDQATRHAAVQQFQSACSKAHIPFSIHRDKSIALQELQHESLFADLIIINEHETFSQSKEQSPTPFIKELLCNVYCPVLVVPDEYKTFDNIVLLYDGSPSSLYAIKMFSYLVDSAKQLPVEVLTIKEELIPVLRLPDNKLMREFMKRHFSGIQYTIVNGNTEELVVSRLKQQGENKIVVLGAYGRSAISRWFKNSLGDVLLKALNTPLFVAHNN